MVMERETKRTVVTTRRVVRTRKVVTKETTSDGEDAALSLPPWVIVLSQFLVLEIPLSCLFLLFLLVNALLYCNTTLWFPQMQANRWTPERAEAELTYYDVSCDAATVVTATNYTPLVLSTSQSNRQRVNIVRKHGAGMFTDLFATVSPDVVASFRSYALRKNQLIGNNEERGDVDVVGVIENDHRWSFAFGVEEHPSIAPLLEAIGQHTVLQETLEGLLGENPAIVELSTITAEAGAITQGWHFDTTQEGDSLKYADTFSDLYSLLIPVQNTTVSMGPTEICPGTHYCSQTTGCDAVGFSSLPDKGVWKAGDGLLFNSHLNHQGTAHTQGPTRVAMVISFVSSSSSHHRNDNDLLLPPLAAGYVIPWNVLGFTFADLARASTTMGPPKSYLRALGLTRSTGWDYFSFCSAHMGNDRDPPMVVLMPYMKLLPMALIGQAKYHDTWSPWQVFILDTLWRMWTFALAASVLGWISYLKILSSVQESSTDATTTNSNSKPPFKTAVMRLLLLHGCMVGLVLWLLKHYVDPSTTAIQPSTTTSMTTSMNTEFSDDYIQSLVPPQAHDVMMGPHFLEESFLWIPGNRLWHASVQNLLPRYLVSLEQHPVFSNAIIDEILDVATVSGEHRVVMQNEHADWIQLSYAQAHDKTRMWMHRLLTTPASDRSPCRSRRHSNAALCQTALDLDYLFSQEAISQEEVMSPKPGQEWRARTLLSVVPDGQSSLRGRTTDVETPAEVATVSASFAVGERVEARPRVTTTKWSRATVTEKLAGQMYMVRFDFDLDAYQLEHPLPARLLRKLDTRVKHGGLPGRDNEKCSVWRPYASQRL